MIVLLVLSGIDAIEIVIELIPFSVACTAWLSVALLQFLHCLLLTCNIEGWQLLSHKFLLRAYGLWLTYWRTLQELRFLHTKISSRTHLSIKEVGKVLQLHRLRGMMIIIIGHDEIIVASRQAQRLLRWRCIGQECLTACSTQIEILSIRIGSVTWRRQGATTAAAGDE